MARLSLLQKTLNLEQTEGKMSAFARCPYALQVRLSKPLAKDGYGRVKVDGKEISKGVCFTMDVFIRLNCLLIPVGEVAHDFDRVYTVSFSGFKAADGSMFKDRSFRFRTLPRRKRDKRYEEDDKVALECAQEGMVLLKN